MFDRNGAISKPGAISLTYEGSAPLIIDEVVPELERRGILATFYDEPPSYLEHARDWKRIGRHGHELGNGCLLPYANRDGSLPKFSLNAIAQDIERANDLIRELFEHRKDFSFAYPMGLPRAANNTDYREVVESIVDVARSGVSGVNHIGSCQPNYLRRIDVSQATLDNMKSVLKLARDNHTWVILSFQVDPLHWNQARLEDHERFLDALDQASPEIRIGPVHDIAMSQVERRTGGFRLA
jgi:peptidoglycan/xylan/chitin deacetylase (PgdA/CDA1 family)